MRYVATYELTGRDGTSLGAVAELPVVSLPAQGADGAATQATVINPELGVAVTFGTAIEHPAGVLDPLFITAVPEPIAAEPGWMADVWTTGFEEEPSVEIGSFEVLAWEQAVTVSPERAPEGTAIVVVREPTDWFEAGPMSTRLMPGLPRFRRRDDPAFGAPTTPTA